MPEDMSVLVFVMVYVTYVFTEMYDAAYVLSCCLLTYDYTLLCHVLSS